MNSKAGLTREERAEEGRKRRQVSGRGDHALLNPQERKFDPIAVLLAASQARVRQLLPIKYARMKVSPFAFFRGAVSIMASDLARLPSSELHVQLCGDAHVQNLGSFAGPDGNLIFDISDFDETVPGPWEWDAKRMSASIVLAGRESGHDRASCKAAAQACIASYCRSMQEFSRQPVLQVARHQVHREQKITPIHAALRQSERATPLELLRKLTEQDGAGVHRFREQKPLLWRVQGKTAKEVLRSLDGYRESLLPERSHIFSLFRSIDVGFKIVGTGSVGLRDYVVLLEGNGPEDYIFLQIKQEVSSAYEKFLPQSTQDKSSTVHNGRRVAEGQRAIQPLSDLFLGWTTIGAHQYLVRQLNDHKGSVDLERLRGDGLKSLAIVAGELLARGHARSGDACQIHGYCGSGEKIAASLTDFAVKYADQTEEDYARFLAAIKSGKINVAAK